MSLILAVRAVVDTGKVPSVPPSVKDALRPIVTSRPLITVLIFLALMGIAASSRMPKLLRVGAIVLVALAVYGWVDHSGVALAAAGGKQENADTATVTAAIVGGGYLLMKVVPGMTKKKPEGPAAALASLIPGLSGDSKKQRRGRGGLR